MSKQTATASTIQITATSPTLMLALELGEESWKLGFSSAFGQIPLVRDIVSRDTQALLAQITLAHVNNEGVIKLSAGRKRHALVCPVDSG